MTTVEEPTTSVLAYSVPVAARLIGIGPLGAWDLVRDGTIPSFVEDGRRLISRQALEDYVTKRKDVAGELA